MKKFWRQSTSGVMTAGLVLSVLGSSALAQNHRENPPAQGDPLPERTPVVRPYDPTVFTDPETGIQSSMVRPIMPTIIPEGGFFPNGTIPQPEREAGRPMRPGGDPWIPDGSGYWLEPTEDLERPQAQPVMMNHEGPGPNGLSPPDPDAAHGRGYSVLATNDDFAVYDSCGNQLYYRDINDFLGISDFLFDPKVIYDPWDQRWVMIYHLRENSPQTSRMLIVVSGSELPFGVPGATHWFYNVNMVQDAGTGDASWADYFDLGYSSNCVTMAGNMFRFAGGFRWGRLFWWNKADLYSAGSLGGWQWWNLTNADGSQTNTPRATKMQTSWTEGGTLVDAHFINSRWTGGNRITLWKVNDFMGSNTLTRVDTPVANYTTPPDAVQPSGGSIDTIDCRLMTAVIANDVRNGNGREVFTALNTASGGDCRIHLMKFDAISNALEFESQFGATGFDYWFASSAADYSGSNFWVFARTANSSGNEPEIRAVDYNQGAFSSSSFLIRDGDGSYNGFRWGDYFGGSLDWGDYWFNGASGGEHKVWLYGEYGRPNSFGTHIGASSVFPQGSISGVSPSGTWTLSGPPGGPFSPSSQNYVLSSADNDVGTAYEVLSLPSWLDASKMGGEVWTGDSVTLSVNSNANGLGLGTYSDTVIFDDCFNGQGQFNRTVTLRVEAPDLDVVSVDVTNGTFNPGDVVNVAGQYRNNGNLATGSFTGDFYISTNSTITPSDTLLGSIRYTSIGAGQTSSYSHNFRLPCLPEGNYYVGVIANVTGDADTSDNVGVDRSPIGLEFCGGDFNGDCNVNTQDVLAFLNAWAAGNSSADCNGDRVINTQDVLCFLNLWNAGC